MFCQDEEANKWACQLGFADLKHMIYHRCGIESRAELDHDEDAYDEFRRIKTEFIRTLGYG